MKLFKTQQKTGADDFEYMDDKFIYLDSACQTLRPQLVLDAVMEYFREYNACGGRVKYDWGIKVDEKVVAVREQILLLLGKSSSEYAVAFTHNTTYGLNLVLGQLPRRFSRVITSDIEHNSVFLSTIEVAKRLDIPRIVLSRTPEGSLEYESSDVAGGIVVLNSMSNIDGRKLVNLKEITEDTHQNGGIILIDAAQSMSHDLEIVRSSDFDALFFSGHKLYGPSLGVIVIKRSLLSALDIHFIGGGMVEDVDRDSYSLVSASSDLSGRLEMGLQDYAGIIGLGAAIRWSECFLVKGENAHDYETRLSQLLFESLAVEPDIRIINTGPTPIISFYSEKIDAHRLAIYLSTQNIMVRSGYFCCHYYLKNLKQYPPLLRVSLGLHNTEKDVRTFMKALKIILTNV